MSEKPVPDPSHSHSFFLQPSLYLRFFFMSASLFFLWTCPGNDNPARFRYTLPDKCSNFLKDLSIVKGFTWRMKNGRVRSSYGEPFRPRSPMKFYHKLLTIVPICDPSRIPCKLTPVTCAHKQSTQELVESNFNYFPSHIHRGSLLLYTVLAY